MTLHTDSEGKQLVDLQATFGKRYRIIREADGATWHQWPEADRLWLLEVRCRYGLVYPKGGEILQAMTPRPRLGAKLRALPCVLSSRGDLETVVTFHVDHAPPVFALLKPYKRKQVSEAERERLRGIGYQRQGQQPHSESDFPALETARTPENEQGQG